MTRPQSEFHEDITQAARLAREAQANLVERIRAACPGPHRMTQRADSRPPWCSVCRYTVDGDRVAG